MSRHIVRRAIIPAGILTGILLFALCGSAAATAGRTQARTSVSGAQAGAIADATGTSSFDFDWKFIAGDPAGAQAPAFDDGAWRTVDLPHDWSIEGKIDPKNPMGGASGFFPAGVGWYRKAFDAPEAWRGRRIGVEFDGVYMNSDVYLNGEHLGFHPYGYTAFFYDLTPHLKYGAANVIAVRVDNSKQQNSRWYTGSGIYRHVWLKVAEPVHVARWGVVATTPEVSVQSAKVLLRTSIENKSGAKTAVTVETVLLSPSGAKAGSAVSKIEVDAGARVEVPQEFRVSNPARWSPDSPKLYRAVTRVLAGGKAFDTVETPFGIRSIAWSAEKGYLLNGKPIELLGGCVHHDNGPLGAAAFDRAEERRVELHKAAGFNAIRTAHNPPSPAFLDACDRLGMLVIDETFDAWQQHKKPYDYALVFNDWWQRDTDAMVLRDRNHPSVIMWSIGNEIPEKATPAGQRTAKMLADYIRKLDPTRPVTSAMNNPPSIPFQQTTPSAAWDNIDPYFSALDIGGYNYNLPREEADHQRVPSRVMVATESFPHDAFKYWAYTVDHPYIVGDFVWTSLDYLGEAGIGRSYYTSNPKERVLGHGDNRLYPWHGAYCGDLDIIGFRKPISYYRNILWNRGEKLYVAVREPVPDGKTLIVTDWGLPPEFASWTWPGGEGKPLAVEVYSRFPTVRLYLNDNLLGEKPTTRAEEFKAEFAVPYAPGVLKAVGVEQGREVAEQILRTTGAAKRIHLAADRTSLRANGEDLSFITVTAVDQNGLANPNATNEIEFEVSGPASIAAVGSGDLTSEELYKANRRALFHGQALIVIRTSREAGPVVVTAKAPGLAAASVNLQSAK